MKCNIIIGAVLFISFFSFELLAAEKLVVPLARVYLSDTDVKKDEKAISPRTQAIANRVKTKKISGVQNPPRKTTH